MRFLADENIPGETMARLRQIGHDVVSVRADMPGISDAEILSWAKRERRILLTFDKDFGELAWVAGLPRESGVILLRLPMPAAATAGAALAARIAERTDWAGHFSVIEPGRVRMRPLRT